MVKKGGDSGVIRKIVELHHEKKLTEISDVQDHSDRNGMRIVIELKRDANPKVVLNKLYKHTPMQSTFGVNMVALVDNVPRSAVAARGHPQLRPAPARSHRPPRQARAARAPSARAHLLEGLLIALDHLDEVIALIRASRDRDTARTGLMERFELTHIQAQAILDLRLQQLTALEADKLRREHADKIERIRELRELLGDEAHGARPDQDRADRDLRALRRRAAHGDRARRGRPRHRGPDRRPADGHLDHELGLHQVAPAGHLPRSSAAAGSASSGWT